MHPRAKNCPLWKLEKLGSPDPPKAPEGSLGPPGGPRTGMSNIYREILRKQYIASFGNIVSEAIFRKYRDILMIFVMNDYGHFWPEIDPKIITTH